MPLTDTFANNIKHIGALAGDRHTDGGSMYLLVTASGEYLHINYRFESKRKTLALGKYPVVLLAKARRRHVKARDCWRTA